METTSGRNYTLAWLALLPSTCTLSALMLVLPSGECIRITQISPSFPGFLVRRYGWEPVVIASTRGGGLWSVLFVCHSVSSCIDITRASIISPVHVFEPFFWTGELLDNFWPQGRVIFDGSIFNADPHELQHVTSCLQSMLFGCTRAMWTERYL